MKNSKTQLQNFDEWMKLCGTICRSFNLLMLITCSSDAKLRKENNFWDKTATKHGLVIFKWVEVSHWTFRPSSSCRTDWFWEWQSSLSTFGDICHSVKTFEKQNATRTKREGGTVTRSKPGGGGGVLMSRHGASVTELETSCKYKYDGRITGSAYGGRMKGGYCSWSRRRAANGSKRMYLDYTHGLFIT